MWDEEGEGEEGVVVIVIEGRRQRRSQEVRARERRELFIYASCLEVTCVFNVYG